MKYLIELNNNTQQAKMLLSIIKNLEKEISGLTIKTEKEWDEIEDIAIAKAIEKKKTGKFVSRNRIIELLDK
jgi:uncharacterized protein YdbL (DUF1318 family)